MSDKVKLPKDVAEELTAMKVHESYPIRLVVDIFHEGITGEDCALKTYFESDRSRRIEIIMKALVNGYEVEQTPEDKVREVINHWELRRSEHGERSQVIDYDKFGARLYGARCVLEMLNIKIEGINA